MKLFTLILLLAVSLALLAAAFICSFSETQVYILTMPFGILSGFFGALALYLIEKKL